MPNFLVAIHHPEGYDASTQEDAQMGLNIDALNGEMVAAGIRVFVGGLHGPKDARGIVARPDGEFEITEGIYLNTKEYVGGFWVLQVANLDEAMEWGKKAAIACKAPVEVRPFH